MALFDQILGLDDLEDQRRETEEAIRSRFDPSRLQPVLNEAQRQAIEGIEDDEIRADAVRSLFRKTPISTEGISSGRGIAVLDRLSQQRQESLGGFETRLGLAEERAKREGRAREAQTRSEMQGLEQERDARIRETRALAEAEASRRKRQFATNIAQLAGTAAGAFLGPGAAAIAGGVGGGIAGGGGGALVGATTGALSSADLGEDETRLTLKEIFGERGEARDAFLADLLGIRPEVQEPEDEILEETIDVGGIDISRFRGF